MIFYRVEADVVENEELKKAFDSVEARREIGKEIGRKTEEFNSDSNSFICVTYYSERRLELTLIIKKHMDINKLIEDYLKVVKIDIKPFTSCEIGLEQIGKSLFTAERKDYIYDCCDTLDKFGLGDVCSPHGISGSFGEVVIAGTNSKEKIYEDASNSFSRLTLVPELDRIYSKKGNKEIIAHPVHYFFNTDNEEIRKKWNRILVEALYQNNRVQTKRYSHAYVDGTPFTISIRDCKQMYEANVGGTVIIRIECSDADDDLVRGELDFIYEICRIIQEYKNKVLTVLTFTKGSAKTKDMIKENLINMSFVEIEEDLSNAAQAKEYLKIKTRDHKIGWDKNLFNKIEEDQSYYSHELNTIFDDWYTSKIKTSVFPQYKDIETVKKENFENKNKGNAYQELEEMIGLQSAKRVIKKALDYHKAKKIFGEKGLNGESLSMHMIFTGNPGTAKTSVARLVARIFRDNKLLSRGHIVEVGRGDLVGKFVGWTAPTIQKKFSEAKGGVLFIDEAYSLVDDRDGCFGDEAINTIVQEMENHRSDVLVIFAGYPDKMQKFLDKNPGLRSRIAFHVPFEDYSAEELCDIAKLMADHRGMKLSDGACEKMTEIFEIAREQKDFGNGRFARNILDSAQMTQATRLINMDYDEVNKSDIQTLSAEDIEMPAMLSKVEKVSIGFTS